VIGCTGFYTTKDNIILVGSNEDWINPKTRVYFFPPEEGKFGRMYVGHSEYPLYPEQQGLNDQGLFYDVFGTPYLKITNGNGKPKLPFGEDIKYHWMWYCSTVDEAIDIFNDYDFRGTGLENAQYFIADRFGNSAIIEGDNIIYKNGDFQVVTNFLQSHPELGGYPCWRYETSVNMLENMLIPSMDYFRDICNETHQEGYYPTDYSLVCDLKNLIVNIYPYHNFENRIILNLTEELNKGYHNITINSFFEPIDNNPPSSPILDGPKRCKVNKEYVFTASSSEPDGDDIFYLFDWGDGNNSGWFRSNKAVLSYSWKSSSIYNIKVKTCDQYGRESEWTNLEITIPKNKSLYELSTLFFKLFKRFPILEFLL
jgi:hypothetical protein